MTSNDHSGASMSGDLKNPSKSIPRGTFSGLGLTFVTYTLVIFAIAASITRDSLYKNANVIQAVSVSLKRRASSNINRPIFLGLLFFSENLRPLSSLH